MKIRNTTTQARGVHFDGALHHIDAGGTAEVPDAAVKKARDSDPVIKGWFDDGVLVHDVDTSAMPRVTVQDAPVAQEETAADIKAEGDQELGEATETHQKRGHHDHGHAKAHIHKK